MVKGDRVHAYEPRAGACVPPPLPDSERFRPALFWARFSSIWAGRSTPASTSPGHAGRRQGLPQGRRSPRSRSSACRSFAIRAAISSPATTGSTASVRRTQRPTVLDRAWNSIETNQFGTNDFIDWCQLVGTEPLLGIQPRHGHGRDGRGLRRVLQPRAGHEVERPAPRARLRAAAQRALLVPGQRNGRPVADRPAAAREYGPQGPRCREADARHRSRSAADRLRIEQHQHADVPDLGSRGAGGMLRPGRRHLAARLLRQHAGADRATARRATWR